MADTRSFFRRIQDALRFQDAPPFVRRLIIGVIGGTVLLIGVAMVVLPGPAIIVIPLGLAILGTEFIWARRLLRKSRGVYRSAKKWFFRTPRGGG
jgi:uncharacterized protein (TIGR02611 family)